MKPIVLIRSGGDIASGVIYRLWRAGYRVVVNEIAHVTLICQRCRLCSLQERPYRW